MRVVIAGLVALLLVGPATRGDDPDKKPPGPKAQYDALVKEHSAAQQAYFKAVGKAKTPEDRQKLMKEEAPKLEKVLAKFLDLARKHPKDAVAVDALLVVARDNMASSAGGTSQKKAREMLAKDHITSDKIGPLCQQLTFDYDGNNDKLLRTILEKNPAKGVQAEACLALAQNLGQRAAIVRRLAADKDAAKRYEGFLGKEKTAELLKLDPAKLEKEGEALSKKFAEKYVGELKPERLVSLCQRLAFSSDKGSEALLRKLAAHDKKEVKGVAVLTLARVLKRQADDKADKDKKAAKKLLKESEKLFEEAQKKYADVKAGSRTVAEVAKGELYEIRHLSIGKAAPEVEGEDQDGKKFKLADYKGKVVMLDFWQQF